MTYRVCLLLLVCAHGVTLAQGPDVTLGGYLKDLVGIYEVPRDTGLWTPGNFQNTLQNRINIRYYPADGLNLSCGIRSLLIYQKNLNPNGIYTSALKETGDLQDLSLVLIDQRDVVLVSQIDRLYLDWVSGPFQAIVGRQRIAWGTNLIWNPTDVFNPYNVLDFDYQERPGVDAIRAQYYTGPTSRVEVGFAPGEFSHERTAVGLVSTNMWEYDFNVMGGAFHEGYVFGFSWAGQIADGGFRGEARYTGDQTTLDPMTKQPGRLSYLLVAISADYTFSSSLYIHTEILFNSDGVMENAGLWWPLAIARGWYSPARWSVYQEFSYDLTLLVRGSFFGLINPSDGSFILVPSASWSVATDWDLFFIALIPQGDDFTEWGPFGTSVFASVKWSF